MVEVYRDLIVCGDCCVRLMNSCRDADPDDHDDRADAFAGGAEGGRADKPSDGAEGGRVEELADGAEGGRADELVNGAVRERADEPSYGAKAGRADELTGGAEGGRVDAEFSLFRTSWIRVAKAVSTFDINLLISFGVFKSRAFFE